MDMTHAGLDIRAAGEEAPGLAKPCWLALALVVPALLAAMVYADFSRQIWYDEMYTLYVTGPQFGWWEALTGHWLADNHPPLFYSLSRATAWLGQSVEARRLLNPTIALLALAAGTAALGRGARSGERLGPERLVLACGYMLACASQDAVMPFAAELRSYFLSFCALAVLVPAVSSVWLDGAPQSLRRRMVLWGSALTAFNIHIVTSFVAASLLLPFAALALARRDWPRFRSLAGAAVTSGLVFCATVALQAGHWTSNTQAFWIPAGAQQVVGAFAILGTFALSANLLLTLGGLCGICLLARQALSLRKLPTELELVLLLLAGVATAFGTLLALHLWRPMIVPKYLIGLFPVIGMVLAICLQAMAARLSRPVGAALILSGAAMALLSIGRGAAAIPALEGWDKAGAVIARQIAACPDTTVHAEPHWNRVLAQLPPADSAQVVPFAYRHVASRHGFAIEPENSRRIAANCPTLFWGQIAGQHPPDKAQLLAWEQAQGYLLDRLEFHLDQGGWIGSTRPLDVKTR